VGAGYGHQLPAHEKTKGDIFAWPFVFHGFPYDYDPCTNILEFFYELRIPRLADNTQQYKMVTLICL
jgi:hypothetical protein